LSKVHAYSLNDLKNKRYRNIRRCRKIIPNNALTTEAAEKDIGFKRKKNQFDLSSVSSFRG
jgi:hypothetical protein